MAIVGKNQVKVIADGLDKVEDQEMLVKNVEVHGVEDVNGGNHYDVYLVGLEI